MDTIAIDVKGKTDFDLKIAALLLQALDIAFTHDLIWRGGRTLADRERVAVEMVNWSLGNAEISDAQ